MQVELTFYGPFRDDVGEASVSWETDAATVGDLLAAVEAEWPALEGRLIGEDDAFAGETAVSLNGTNVRHREGLETALSDGDVVRMIPAVYGG